MYTNPPLRSNTLLPSFGWSTGTLGAATPPRTLPPSCLSVCVRRAVPGAPDWVWVSRVAGYPDGGAEEAAALVNGALLGGCSRRGAAGGVHPSHTCLGCSPSLPAAWLTAARRAGALRAARGVRRRVPPRIVSPYRAATAPAVRDASAVEGPAGATRAVGVVMVPPIISERASALTLLRELAQSVRPFAPVAYGYGARWWRGKDPRRSFPALRENRAFSTPTPSAARSRRC
mmetsp:Transcript_7547/g.30594  ORF Transcript_7547/g.30594 Transcript_7547/m.30594 type:complete len:231 (-) Transcript_7547:80-772(-)